MANRNNQDGLFSLGILGLLIWAAYHMFFKKTETQKAIEESENEANDNDAPIGDEPRPDNTNGTTPIHGGDSGISDPDPWYINPTEDNVGVDVGTAFDGDFQIMH